MTSQIFCYHCVEYIKFDNCAKFHDHQSNNKVMIGGPSWPPPKLTVQKSPCQSIICPDLKTWPQERRSEFSRLFYTMRRFRSQGLELALHRMFCSFQIILHFPDLKMSFNYSLTNISHFQIVSQFPDYFAFFRKFLSFARILQIPVSQGIVGMLGKVICYALCERVIGQ